MTITTSDKLEQQVRENGTLIERLHECQERIGKMCKEHRPPKMTIPVQWHDDDFFISTTIYNAIASTELLKRLSDYVRLEIETGSVKPNSPIGIAWRDYAERFEVPEASWYYQGVLQKVAALYHAEGVEFTTRRTKLAPDAGDSAASSGIVNASAESTSQTDPTPTQRG